MAWIRTSHIKPGQPRSLKLNDPEPSVEDGKFGKEWIYDVNNGDKFTATETLSSMIQEVVHEWGIGAGDSIIITREGKGTETRWGVEPAAQDGSRIQDPFTDKPGPVPSQSGNVQASDYRQFSDLKDNYTNCLHHAIDLCGDVFPEGFTNEDVRAVATTLFIQANRDGMTVPKV